MVPAFSRVLVFFLGAGDGEGCCAAGSARPGAAACLTYGAGVSATGRCAEREDWLLRLDGEAPSVWTNVPVDGSYL